MPAEETEHVRAVHHAWVEHLGPSAASPGTNFFAAGGNSLLAASLLGELSERFNQSLPLRVLVRNPTLGALCVAIDGLLAARPDDVADRHA